MKAHILAHFGGNYLPFFSRYCSGIKKEGKQFMALCPFHKEKKGSLSINHETGLYCCHGCGEKGDLFTFYAKMNSLDAKSQFREVLQGLANEFGITMPIKEKKAARFKLVKEYSYTDENGKELFQCCRMEPKDFRQRRRENGKWISNLNGVRRVLYRLPEVVKAQQVLLVEGEKDADNAAALGFVATTCPMGGGKWREEYSEFLMAKDVVIFPDNDETGKKHAAQVARSLAGKALSVRIVELPGLPEKGDLSDFIAMDHATAAQRIADEISKAQLVDVQAMAAVAERPKMPFDEFGYQTGEWIGRKKEDFRVVARCLFKTVSRIQTERGEYFDVELSGKNCQGKIITQMVEFTPDSFSPGGMRKLMAETVRGELRWEGSDQALKRLPAHFAYQESAKILQGTTVAGIHHGGFVCGTGYIGPEEKRLALVGKNKCVKCSLPLVQPLCYGWEPLLTFNETAIVAVVLGWVGASFMAPAIRRVMKKFPILHIAGESGSGKTSTVTEILMPIWGLEEPSSTFNSDKDFPSLHELSKSNSIPKIFEEAKRLNNDRLQKAIEASYNGFGTDRGYVSVGTVGTETVDASRPMVLSSLKHFAACEIQDRLVVAELTEAVSSQHTAGFLQAAGLPLARLGRAVLEYCLTLSDPMVRAGIEAELGQLPQALRPRPKQNAAIVRWGLRVLGKAAGLSIDESYFEAIGQNQAVADSDRISQLISTLSIFGEMTDLPSHDYYKLSRDTHFIVEPPELFLNLPLIYNLANERQGRGLHKSVDFLDLPTLRSQIRKAPFFIQGDNRKYFRYIGQVRAMRLNIDDLQAEMGVLFPNAWGVPDDNDNDSDNTTAPASNGDAAAPGGNGNDNATAPASNAQEWAAGQQHCPAGNNGGGAVHQVADR